MKKRTEKRTEQQKEKHGRFRQGRKRENKEKAKGCGLEELSEEKNW